MQQFYLATCLLTYFLYSFFSWCTNFHQNLTQCKTYSMLSWSAYLARRGEKCQTFFPWEDRKKVTSSLNGMINQSYLSCNIKNTFLLDKATWLKGYLYCRFNIFHFLCLSFWNTFSPIVELQILIKYFQIKKNF